MIKTSSLARMGPASTYTLEDGSTITVPDSATALYNPSHEIPHDDMTDLDDMHAASVLNLARMRYLDDIVYTNVGNIVIAVNPYRSLPGLYDLPCETARPHIFHVSRRAYDSLWSEQRSQVIVVNGESGAGKTESTKIMVRHLTWLSSELEATHEEADDYGSFDVGAARVVVFDSDDDNDADAAKAPAAIPAAKATAAATATVQTATPPAPRSSYEIDDLVLSSNAVCEAFGNAKTIHNLNSSRFGKFLSLHFDQATRCIDACTVHHFLLEKSRVANHAHGERNFHIFYHLVRGAGAAQRKAWRLGNRSVEDYHFLRSAAPVQLETRGSKRRMTTKASQEKALRAAAARNIIEPQDDAAAFATTFKSLRDVGFSEEETDEMFSLLSAVLLLGNLRFSTSQSPPSSPLQGQQAKKKGPPPAPESLRKIGPPPAPESSHLIAQLRCDKEDTKVHADLAQVLGLDPKTAAVTLAKATTTRVMRTKRRSITEIMLTLAEAEASRDGLAKYLYSALFDYVFDRLNQRGGGGGGHQGLRGDQGANTIGVLDIFGFEILPHNSFEQLCINYANESLQALYNDYVFQQELQQYDEEGLDSSNITYTDNSHLLSMLDGRKPVGVFLLVDQTGMRGGEAASDTAFLNLVNSTFGNVSKPHPFFARPRFGGESFIVKHFAGDVTYSVDGFVKKNNDALHADLRAMLHRCEAPIISRLRLRGDAALEEQDGPADPEAAAEAAEAKSASDRPNRLTGTMTVGKQVRIEMKTLSTIIHSASPHFVRCIKPNATMSPAPAFDKPLVLQQLRHLGCLETCRIRRQGFPVRRRFQDIVEEYGMLLALGRYTDGKGAVEELGEANTGALRKACVELLERFACPLTPSRSASDDTGAADQAGQDLFRVGNTKVFLRDGVLDVLNAAMDAYLARRAAAALRIQTKLRQANAATLTERLRVERQRTLAAQRLQATLRGHHGRRRVKEMRAAEAEAREAARLKAEAKAKAQAEAKAKAEAEAKAEAARIKADAEAKAKRTKAEAEAKAKAEAEARAKAEAEARARVEAEARARAEAEARAMAEAARIQAEAEAKAKAEAEARAMAEAARIKAEAEAKAKAEAAARAKAEAEAKAKADAEAKARAEARGAIALQRVFRGNHARRRFNPFLQIRRPWKHLLAPNEVLLRVSYSLKYAGTGISRVFGLKRRRLLFLTSAGRVIYADPKSAKAKGAFQLDNNDAFGVNMIDDALFEFIAPSRKYKFLDLFRDSKGWAKTVKLFLIHVQEDKGQATESAAAAGIKKKKRTKKKQGAYALPLSAFMFSVDMDPTLAYLKQGTLCKQKVGGGRRFSGVPADGEVAAQHGKARWSARWFILHGDALYWFKADGEGKPRGKIVVGADSKIVSSADRDFCFKLKTPLFPNGVLLAAGSTGDKRVWMRALKRTIRRAKEKQERRRPSRLALDTNKKWHSRMVSMLPARASILGAGGPLGAVALPEGGESKGADGGAAAAYAQAYEFGFDSGSDDDDEGAGGGVGSSDGGAGDGRPPTHRKQKSADHLFLDKKDSAPVLF